MESGINAFSIVLLVYLISSSLSSPENFIKNPGKFLLISFASILTLFSRLDNIFLVGIFGVWLVFIDSQIRWMALLDFLIILLSLTISFFTRLQFNENIFDFVPYFNFHLILSLALRPTFFYFLGLYELEKENFYQSLVKIFISIFLSLLLAVFLPVPAFAAVSMVSEDLCRKGKFYYERGDYAKAVHELSKAILVDPKNEEARGYLQQLGIKDGLYGRQNPPLSQIAALAHDIQQYKREVQSLEEKTRKQAGLNKLLEQDKQYFRQAILNKETENQILKEKVVTVEQDAAVRQKESRKALDELEHGFGARIPLWLFGFLY